MIESLAETFCQATLDSRLRWYNEPARWEVDTRAGCLRLWADGKTDFWQRTHYGFRADNGHLLHAPIDGDAVVETRLRLDPKHQYDQAGLMIWLSPSCWIKASVEFELEGPSQLGVVVTHGGYSDWSMQPVESAIRQWWFRIRLSQREVLAETSWNGSDWLLLRMASLLERMPGESVRGGLYACSPTEAGFMAEFDYLSISPPA